MKAQKRWRLQYDRGTDQPTRTDQERTQAGDHATGQTELGWTSSGPIQNQQLVLDEYGFRDNGTGAARASQPGNSRQQVQKMNRQIAHRAILPTSWNRQLLSI
jgi:hypothetical protein